MNITNLVKLGVLGAAAAAGYVLYSKKTKEAARDTEVIDILPEEKIEEKSR